MKSRRSAYYSSVIKSQVIFKKKLNTDGTVDKYKARIVACGYSQIEGIDYSSTYAPVARFETIRTLIASAVDHSEWEIQQFDFKGAYLSGDIDCEIYKELPFCATEEIKKVGKLLKGLYGLKQSGRL